MGLKLCNILEDGCMSIELVWGAFSSSLYPISIYRFFSSLFSPSSKLRKNFTRYFQCGTKFLYWHIKPYVRMVQSFFVNIGIMVASYCLFMKASLAFVANLT